VTILTTPLGFVGIASIVYTVYLLANLSRRLGAVTKMRPYYYGFYVAIGLLVVALLTRILRGNVIFAPAIGPDFVRNPLFYLTAYHLPFALAVTISVVVTWLYWGWLFKESEL
jgi:hypothetical protein